tara:strand:- start:2235 stop:2912 length:678 start_codon:yes stop_codon:yes gene_type:complete
MKNNLKLSQLLIVTLFVTIFSCSSDDDAVTVSNTNITPPLTEVDYTLTLQPSAAEGKDAFIYTANMDANFANHTDFMVFQNSSITRSLMQFDLTDIPTDATINTAELSLFGYTSPSNGSNYGFNESLLQKLDTAWSEDTVTWNNQPSSSSLNQVTLAQSTSTNQDYLNIDIKAMISDMVEDPSINHGFVFKLADETASAKMVFGSSDNPDSNLHPKLVISYTVLE